MDVGTVKEALQLVEEDDLAGAARLLGKLVRGKRLVRASGSTAAVEEVEEVKGWLRKVLLNPDVEDADSLVTRAYYKLRSQMPAESADRG